MTRLADLAVDALAVARLARLATVDTLPPAAALRERAEAAIERRHGAEWAEVVRCPWCASMYLAVGAVTARRLFPRAWGALARVLAFSEVAGLLASHEGD